MGDMAQFRNDTSDKSKREANKEDSKPEFSEDEESLMARMFRLVGPRWTLIAGRIPGRTVEEIEKYFTDDKYASSRSSRG